jgi:DNA-binding NarL/FixJ family response regulator
MGNSLRSVTHHLSVPQPPRALGTVGPAKRVSPRVARTSLLLVEEDAIVRSWIRESLEGSEFWIAAEATGGDLALELARRWPPRLVLVDYRLPDAPGTTLVRRLRAEGVDAPVLMITTNAERGLNELAHQAGAQGTALKSADRAGLLAALRAVAAGEHHFDALHPQRTPGRAALTPRERAVIRLIADGYTNQGVAERLGVGRETVKTHVSRTLMKLGARTRAQAVSTAQSRGLL